MGLPAWAAIKVESVTGASNWEEEGGSVIVYGGFAGSDTSCVSNEDGTCNNCTVSLVACNERRALVGSDLSITIKSDSAASIGPVIITTSDGNTQIGTDGDRVGKDTVGTVKMSWSTLCSAAFSGKAGASCATTTNPSDIATLKIGVDENDDGQLSTSEGDTIQVKVHMPVTADTIDHCNDSGATFTDGICAFTAFPGDEKVYIEDLDPTTTFPNSGNIQFSHARFFYSTVGFTGGVDGANPGSQFGHVDIEIETEGDEYFLSKNNVDGLENGTYYFFRISMLDQAKNVAFITSDNAILFGCGKAANTLAPDATDDANCQFIARPDEVVGLLSEDVNCFIATAAYGSSLDRHLKTFRKFRHKILLTSDFGKRLVRSYYKFGPYGARWMNNNSWAKPIARLLLWPVWAWTALSLKVGVWLSTLVFLSSFLLMILLGRQLLMWRRTHEMVP
ncbi:MAG: hypothetical protein H6624_18665 [Bdellovibrionaceae bacterium]|nr:hypothetical protein [Bdellovibrionales bacterium]MCB9086369.1 hypothetical protein [Pseudobdellovibrionaceae bacterium]